MCGRGGKVYIGEGREVGRERKSERREEVGGEKRGVRARGNDCVANCYMHSLVRVEGR